MHRKVNSEENGDEVITPAYADDAEDVDIPRSARIPMWITNLGDIHIGLLKAILRELPPVVFSRYQLRTALVPPNKRQVPRDEAMKLITFVSGFTDASYVSDDMRVWGNLISACREAASELGNRDKVVSMPPNWCVEGVYELDIVECTRVDDMDRSVRLCNRYTKCCVLVPGVFLEMLDPTRGLCVESNWNVAEAVISDGSSCSKTCAAIMSARLTHLSDKVSSSDVAPRCRMHTNASAPVATTHTIVLETTSSDIKSAIYQCLRRRRVGRR